MFPNAIFELQEVPNVYIFKLHGCHSLFIHLFIYLFETSEQRISLDALEFQEFLKLEGI